LISCGLLQVLTTKKSVLFVKK